MKNVIKPLKSVSLDTMIEKHIGKVGTQRRDAFEDKLKVELLGDEIRCAKKISHDDKI